MDFYRKFFRCLYRTAVLFYPVCVPGVGAGADYRRKHPEVAGGAVGCVLLSDLVFFPPVGSGVPVGACLGFFLLYAFYTLPCLVCIPIIWKNSSRAVVGVPGRRGCWWCCRIWCSCRGLFAFYTLPCLVILPNIWKNSNRAAAGVRFLLKKRTKKRKHGNV